MILFFDTFILTENKNVDQVKNIGGKSTRRTILENQARSNYSYRHHPKLEITKYTLVSYSVLPWEKVIIRYEIDDGKRDLDFESFVKTYFLYALSKTKDLILLKNSVRQYPNIVTTQIWYSSHQIMIKFM